MNMIRSLRVKNFRGLPEEPIFFDSFCDLTEKMSLGKTTVLEVISKIQTFVFNEQHLSDCFTPKDSTRGGDETSQSFEIEVVIPLVSPNPFIYSFKINVKDVASVVEETLQHEGETLFVLDNRTLTFHGNQSYAHKPLYPPSNQSALSYWLTKNNDVKVNAFTEFMSKIIVCNMQVDNIIDVSDKEDTFLNFKTNNFVSWFRKSCHSEISRVIAFYESLKNEIDSFVDFSIQDGRLNQKTLIITKKNANGAKYKLMFSELSNKEKQIFVFNALLNLSPYNKVLLLDNFGLTVLKDEKNKADQFIVVTN